MDELGEWIQAIVLAFVLIAIVGAIIHFCHALAAMPLWAIIIILILIFL
jgi:hypothetical protein